MPKKDMQNLWQLLADLFTELPWPVRWSFGAGLAGGLALGLYLVSEVDAGDLRFGVFRFLQFFVLGVGALGGLLGLGIGALIELILGEFRPPRPPRRRR